ncbi:MAG: class II aldolase/adducin family protein [Myxococcales bacterium]|nr:class II aldolase/adducin family protein [Myxococcales bacterium]MCB9522300.1 class II aldolase/adducin family protein [Myxococcales bacterium]
MTEAQARRDLVRYSLAMHRAGWVANHDGNLSARVAPDRVICTPTAFSKADVTLSELVVVDDAGKKVAGARRPFSEIALHAAIYSARPDVHAVVHAHPQHATAYGVAGRTIPHPFLPEAVVSLGADIPLVPLTEPGTPAVAALAPFIRRCDAVAVAGNGVFAWGPTLELAYLRLELVEHLARIAWTAQPLGGVQALPPAMVASLVAKRRSGGLAAPEEGAPMGASAAAATPVESGVLARVQAGLPGTSPALVAEITAQIKAALGR